MLLNFRLVGERWARSSPESERNFSLILIFSIIPPSHLAQHLAQDILLLWLRLWGRIVLLNLWGLTMGAWLSRSTPGVRFDGDPQGPVQPELCRKGLDVYWQHRQLQKVDLLLPLSTGDEPGGLRLTVVGEAAWRRANGCAPSRVWARGKGSLHLQVGMNADLLCPYSILVTEWLVRDAAVKPKSGALWMCWLPFCKVPGFSEAPVRSSVGHPKLFKAPLKEDQNLQGSIFLKKGKERTIL